MQSLGVTISEVLVSFLKKAISNDAFNFISQTFSPTLEIVSSSNGRSCCGLKREMILVNSPFS